MTSSPWKILGTAFTVVAIVIGGIAVWSYVGRPDPQIENQAQTYQHAISKIVFTDIDSGDVHIRGGADHAKDAVAIDRRLSWTHNKPTYSENWDGDTLRIKVYCVDSGWWWRDNCAIDYDVKVPADVAVEVETTSGDINVSGTTGVVKLTATSGDADLTNTSGPVSVRLTSGDLTTDNLSSTAVDAEITSGDARLNFDIAPLTVGVRVTSGDISILVPQADYRVDVDTNSGDRKVSIPNVAGAQRSITASSTSGDVAVGYRVG